MADTMSSKEAPSNEALELNEVENSGNLFEKGMRLGYEKDDLIKELRGLKESSSDEENDEYKALEVEIALVDTQIDSLATQWAEKKVSNLIKDPERLAKRVDVRKKHFLARLHRKLVRNGNKITRYEKGDESTERTLNRRLGRLERKQQRKDAKQEARSERHAGRKASPARQARWTAEDTREDAQQKRKADRIKDRLERKMDKTGDKRDASTVVYDKAGAGDLGGPWNADDPSYANRGDQDNTDVFDQGGIEGGYRQDQLGTHHPDGSVVMRLLHAEPAIEPGALNSADVHEQMQAIHVVYADEPDTIAYFEDALAQPAGSEDRKEAIADLQDRQNELSEPYKIFKDGEIARRQVDKADLSSRMWEKTKTLCSDFSKNPLAIAGVVGLFIGAYLLSDKIFTKKNATILGGIAAVLGLGVAGDAALKSWSSSHEGFFDRLGIHPGDAFSPEVLEKFRKEHFPGMPQADRNSVNDMIRLLEVPMTSVNDSFQATLDDHTLEIDTESFLGQPGIKDKEEGRMDGKSLHKGLAWFYGECAERACEDTKSPVPTDRDKKLRMGLAYAKANFRGMNFGEATTKLKIDIPSKKTTVANADANTDAIPVQNRKVEPFRRELLRPRESKLQALISNDPDFRKSLWELPSGELLVEGYPYKYHYSDQGKFVFADAMNPSRVTAIPENLQPGALHRQLSALIAVSKTETSKKFDAVKGSLTGTLSYRPSGEWELVPPLDRMSHEGLDPTMSTDKIPFLYYADQTGFHMTFDGAKNQASFESIDALRKAYDLERVVPELVTKDANHLLLGLDFTVESVTDAPDKSTTVMIRYDSGHTGTLTYKDGHLEGLNLEMTAALNTLWDKQAHKDTVALFSRSTVQEKIIQATGIDSDVYFRWNNVVTTGLVPSEPNVEFAGGFFGTVGKTFSEVVSKILDSNDFTGSTIAAREKAETEAKVRQDLDALGARMHTGLTELYKKGLSKTEYEAQKKTLMEGYEREITGIVSSAPLDISLPPEDVAKMKNESDSRIAEALAPMKHLVTLDRNQVELYNAQLTELQQKAAREIDALGVNPKKSAVEAVIQKYCALATAKANAHRGLDATQSGDKLRDDALTGAHKLEWKGPTEKVYSFIKERFNWEPAQINELMKIYYAKIENGNAPASLASADAYATYFESSVYMILGGKQTNFERASQIFFDEFETKKPVLLSIKSSRELTANRETLPTPPELKGPKEMYKERAKAEFQTWFAQNMDLSTWTGIEWKWPNTFKDSVNKRFERIVMDDTLTSLQLSEKVKRFKQFTVVEYALYKICIDGGYHGATNPEEVRDRIVKKNYDVVWPSSGDYNAYAAKLDKDFGENVAGYQFGLLARRVTQLATIGALGAVALLVI